LPQLIAPQTKAKIKNKILYFFIICLVVFEL
jgi:hypothetical protein